MKNKRIKIGPIIFIVIIIGICFGIKITLLDNKKENNANKEIIKKNEPPIEEIDEIYNDTNKIKLGIYLEENKNFKLIQKHQNIYQMSTDIGWFNIFASNSSNINGSNFQQTWWNHWNSYNQKGYKIGYNVKFTIKNGNVINQNILSPSNADKVWPYLFIYVYDDVNVEPGSWYSHLENKNIKDNTLFTSIKLTGCYNSHEITSPIELTAFTYKDKEDFDPDTNFYRGNSSYTISITKK